MNRRELAGSKFAVTHWTPQRERVEGVVYCDGLGGIHDSDAVCEGGGHYAVYRDIQHADEARALRQVEMTRAPR